MIVLLSHRPAAPVGGLPAVHTYLTESPEARQPPVHHGAANGPYLPRRQHRSKSTSVPAQRQRSNSIISVGDSPLAPQPAALGLQLGSRREDATSSSPEPAQMLVSTRRSLQYSLPPDFSRTPTPDTSPEPEPLALGVNRTSAKFPKNLHDIEESVTVKSVVSCMRNRVDEDRFIAATQVATALVKDRPL
ncbi:TPA: hypothetical protein ACH3X1_010515 [Trebouxia sp. C0004]